MAEDLLRREPCGRNTGMGCLCGAGFGLGRFSMQMHRKIRNVPFPRPYGATGMMHKNFMHQHLRIFTVQRTCMKFYCLR